jgi:hypothetical protein
MGQSNKTQSRKLIAECVEKYGLDHLTHADIRAYVQQVRPELTVPATTISRVLANKKRKVGKPKRLRPGQRVVIEGQAYRSIRHAAELLGLSHEGVRKRLKSETFPNWRFADES